MVKEKIIIFGTTNYSHMLRDLIEEEDAAEVVAYTIDRKYINPTEDIVSYDGYPIIPFDELEYHYSPTEYKILNTIGYTKMNIIREMKSKECLSKGYKLFNFISKDAKICTEINSQGIIIFPDAYVGHNVTIGDNVIINKGCLLTHDIDIGNNTFVAARATLGGNVIVGNNSFLGLNCTIKNGVNIGEFSLIGAATYISVNTDPYSVYVPERSIKLEKVSTELF